MKISRAFKRFIPIFLIITFCLVSFGQSSENIIATKASSISQLEAKIKEYEKQRKEAEAKVKETQGDAAKEKENQAAINDKITAVQGLLTAQDEKIATLSAEITATEQKLVEQEAAIAKGIEDFKLRLRAMYLSGNDSVASIMLGSSDFYDMLMKLELCKRVAEYDNDIIDNLITLKNDYEATKVSLETSKADEETTKASYTANMTELQSLYAQSQSNIQSLKSQEYQYKAQSAEFQKKEKAMEAEIDRIIEEQRKANEGYVGGEFTWPVPNFYRITSPFGWRAWDNKNHNGIDIASPGIYRQPIVAANAGRVIIAQSSYIPTYSYGRYVVIDHGGGFTTIYGHADSLNVNAGDYVQKGQTIAYVGTTGNSTGYHLHFEIRLNGVPQNPMNYYTKK